MKQVLPIEFALSNIKTEEFATFTENFSMDKPVEIGTSLSFSIIDLENKLVLIDLSIECGIKKKTFLKIRVLFQYRIEKKSWESLKNENTYIFPKNLVTHLSVLSLGTLRGILYEKIHNSSELISNYILPLINISDLITENVEVILE